MRILFVHRQTVQVCRSGRRYVGPRTATVRRSQYAAIPTHDQTHSIDHHTTLHSVPRSIELVADARGGAFVLISPEKHVVAVADLRQSQPRSSQATYAVIKASRDIRMVIVVSSRRYP